MALKSTGRRGFTLVEVILVVVISLILLGVSLPHFAQAYKGSKLRIASRMVARMARYSRSMAIMREKTMTLVINHETMEIFLGGATQPPSSEADGELDQDILKRLGYVEGEGAVDDVGIEREVHRFFPEGIELAHFERAGQDDEATFADHYLIRYYSDGQSDGFVLKLEDQRGLGVRLESDPISGKIRSEFTQ